MNVAFCLSLSDGWIAGVNYYCNLLDAVYSLPKDERKIEIYIFMPRGGDLSVFEGIVPSSNVIQLSCLRLGSLANLFDRLILKVFNCSPILSFFLRKYKIDLLSHSQYFSRNFTCKTSAWIPDFQHHYYPEYFEKEDLQIRHESIRLQIESCDHVVLSSHSALEDMGKIYGERKDASVLRFYKRYSSLDFDETKVQEIIKKYDICGKFILLPNQFWKHKNHKLFFKAIALLKKRGKEPLVLCTGNTEDYRNKNYFNELKDEIASSELEKNVKILGLIPRDDLTILMQESHFMTNPSQFEGWSTSVEEARALGKTILLSDINTHKEQVPTGSVFFSVDDVEDLCLKVEELWAKDSFELNFDPEKECAEKFRRFGLNFQDIVKKIK